MSKVGDNDGLSKAGQNAEALKGKLEGVRNAGIALGAIGAVGLVLAENLASAFVEADRLGGRMASLLTAKGLQSGIEQVKELGFAIAGLTGGDDDEVASAIASAIASGRVAGLRQFGIAIDGAGLEAIKAAGNISESAKSQEIFNQVMLAGARAVKDLKENTSESTQAIGEMSVRFGNLQEGFGEGAANVKAALYNGILAPIMDILEASPGLQETGGAFLYIGSMATSGLGSVLAFTAQVGMSIPALEAMGITGVGSLTAIRTAAMTASVGINMATLAVTGIGIAAALTVAYVAYAIGQHIGWINSELTFVQALTLGWKDLGDRVGATSNQAALARNEIDAKSEISKDKSKNAKDADDGKITREEEKKRNDASELKWRDKLASEARRLGDDAEYLKQRDAANTVRDKPQMPKMGVAPIMPAMMPSVGVVLGTSPTEGAAADGDADSIQSQIDSLPSGKGGASMKKSLQVQLRHAKEAERDTARQSKAREKVAKAQAKRADKLEDYQANILKAQADEEADTAVAQMEAQRPKKGTDTALEARIAAVKADREKKIADIEARAVGDDDPQRANSIRQIASIKAAGLLARAGIVKGGGSGISGLARLMAGGGMASLGNGSGDGGSSGASAGGGSQTVDIPLNEHIQTSRNSMGQIVLNFVGSITLPPDSFRTAASAYRK